MKHWLNRLTQEEQSLLVKVEKEHRISNDDALELYNSDNLAFLGYLAHKIRLRKHGIEAYFNRNFHIEPTNICIYECKFCSYARKPNEDGAWEHSLDEVETQAKAFANKKVTEAHIVGGVHPKRGVEYYAELIGRVKKVLPNAHIKAFTAIELKVMFARSGMTNKEGLLALKAAGLDSIPGGGAEIFAADIRSQICQTKADADEYLAIHQTAHENGVPSNCTILYGHLENYAHRVDHLSRLRDLQDKTRGFNCFIPLKYRNMNNELSSLKEVSVIEDLKNYAISRIYLDNIPHIKAYWPMIGKHTAQLSLSYGVDDLDGTIDDSTKIYSMAGAEDKNPSMNTDALVSLIKSAGFSPVERDSLYNVLLRFNS